MSIRDQIVASLMELENEVATIVSSTARAEILSSSAKDVMTFYSPEGRRLEPEASVAYLKLLLQFVTEGSSGRVESALSTRVSTAVEKGLSDFLGGTKVRDAIAVALQGSLETGSHSAELVKSESQWAATELSTALGVNTAGAAAERLLGAGADQLSAFAQSAAGKAMMMSIAKVTATAGGKVLFSKAILGVAYKVFGTTSLRALVTAIIKKVGVAALTKVALVKILLVMLPAALVAKIPIFWVVLPILAGFIYYEMGKLPTKLAEKVPPAVSDALRLNWAEISGQVADAMIVAAASEISRGSTS